jgi:hypothetical protein
MTPRSVLKLKVDDMRAACRRARWSTWSIWRCISTAASCTSSWDQMDDEAIIAELVAIRGIGRWTAEMFLIFHLRGPMCCRWTTWADQGHQPELFFGRAGQPQRCARGGRGLEALVQRGHLVYLALARPAAG